MKKTMWIKGFMQWKILRLPFMSRCFHKTKEKAIINISLQNRNSLVVGYCCTQCLILHCLGSVCISGFQSGWDLLQLWCFCFYKKEVVILIPLLIYWVMTSTGDMDATGTKRQTVASSLGKHFQKVLCSTFESALLAMTPAMFGVIWGTDLKLARYCFWNLREVLF